MHELLNKIFESGSIVNKNNAVINLHSHTPKDQCEFLQRIISLNKFSKSIEIGFAYGISTLAIIDEIAKNGGSHVVIDKFQISDWGSVGIDLIEQAGYKDKVQFYEDYCYRVLPGFLDQGAQFDFAYIDSTKQMDWLLVDFFYIDKILKVGGIIVFDDVQFPGIRKLVRYIAQFPNYKVYQSFPSNVLQSKKRRFLNSLKFIPKSKYFIKPEIIRDDFDLGINSNCVALQKLGDDNRNWDWHVDF